MKMKFASLVITAFTLLVAFAFPKQGFSQALGCPPNIDWEFGDTTGWTAFWGDRGPSEGVLNGTSPYPGGVPQTLILTPHNGFVTGRHDIMTTAMPADGFGGFPVVSPLGGQYSIRISNQITGGDGDRLRYKFTVPSNVNNYSVRFLYAVVLEDPGTGHGDHQRPRFTVTVRDSATGQPFREGCSDLNFIVQPNLPGFFLSTVRTNVWYKPWTQHVLNLSGSAGKTVLIEVTAGDCSLGGHFGYGYFDVLGCEEYNVTIAGDSCNLDRGGVSLRGPLGFMTYEWFREINSTTWQLVDTGEFVTLQPNSTTPHVFKLVATPFPSVSLCKDTLTTLPYADINVNKIDSTCMEPNISVVLDADIHGGSGPLTYAWSEANPINTLSCTSCQIPTVTTPSTNYYTVKVQDTVGCHRSETMVMHVNENTVDGIDDFVVCRPGYTQLDVNAAGPAPLTPVVCGLDTSAACATPDTIEMSTQYREPMGSKADTSTVNNPFAAKYTSAHMQFIVKKEDLYAAGMKHGRLTSLGFEVKDPGTASFNTFKISLACTEQNTLGGAFVPNVIGVYNAATPVTPVAGWNDFQFDETYSWDMTKNLVVDVCFSGRTTDVPASVIVLNTGTQDAIVGYTVSPVGNVCLNGKTDDIVVHSGRPNMRAGYCQSADTTFQYTWSPSIYLQDSTIKSPVAYVNKNMTYYVQTIGISDCLVKDTTNITVPIHDYDIHPRDTSICFGHQFKMIAYGTPASVQWYEVDSVTHVFSAVTDLSCEGCDDPAKSQTPIAKPANDKVYAVEYTDQYNCKDTFFVDVEVRPLPVVRILNDDTTIKYGQDLQLLVSGAYLYSWTPLSSVTHPNLANPHVAPTEPTTFYVWGLAEDGCRNIDSVKVNIDYRDNLFVPSAFTPNGDGKNDVFRVSNLTFQKLQEFRVFNRWGQEIYSTTDPRKGWDGSWRGVPQDMGAYQYLIKVAYPDGLIETYKGDVTLIR